MKLKISLPSFNTEGFSCCGLVGVGIGGGAFGFSASGRARLKLSRSARFLISATDLETNFKSSVLLLKAARSNHSGGVNVLFCDGHVAFAKNTVAVTVWRALATRNGGEVVSSDAF